jgi:hypothetical protein
MPVCQIHNAELDDGECWECYADLEEIDYLDYLRQKYEDDTLASDEISALTDSEGSTGEGTA